MRKSVLGSSMFLLMFIGSSGAYAEVNDRNCDDFSSHQEVMEFWYSNGYNANNDPHDLDRDNDGLACEVTQSEYDSFVASKEAGSSDNGDEAAEETVEGEEMPDTASDNPLMMLLGAGAAAAGSLLLFRRNKQEA